MAVANTLRLLGQPQWRLGLIELGRTDQRLLYFSTTLCRCNLLSQFGHLDFVTRLDTLQLGFQPLDLLFLQGDARLFRPLPLALLD